MLKARDFRYDAWNKLSGKWGTLALISFVTGLITGAIGALPYVGVVGVMLITGPLALGMAIVVRNVIRLQPVDFSQVFDGFKNFANSFLLALLISIFTALWSLLLIIPGIIAAYSYRLSFYILADNPTMSSEAARKASIEMMRGNKWRLFCLDCSFIGWYLLCVLTFGILTFWVTPYHDTASFAFYQSLIAERAASQNPPIYDNGGFNQPQQHAPEDPFKQGENKNNTDNTF